MSKIKEKMTQIIQAQPDDATYDEILKELAFERMIQKGLEDSRNKRVISDDDVKQRIESLIPNN